jgi:hypothetical protein
VIKPAAVVAIVVGAGMSTAMCGSMLGNHTVEANCQARIRSKSRVRFGRYAKILLFRIPEDRDANPVSSL